ncbi:mycothione reductase [Sciscionella marina]|uniref:mycothione reductase n=1 Tax=Sciscionella marina TaxID=508770 RepID=UPI0003739F32|nr:mycothione reductase [Sciscionella marina]
MRHFDLVIIGTGSANSILGPEFAGKSVALIEHGTFGGTCLNVGCIPTKMFVHTADIAATPGHSSAFGVDETLDAVHWPKIRDRIFGRIDPIAAGGRDYRINHADNENVTVFEAHAVFSGPKTLTLSPNDGGAPEEISSETIVVAAGGRPVIPPIEGIESSGYHTSNTIMRLERLPRRLAILGSGFIAAEFAHVFAALGVEVTLIARSSAILRAEDETVSERITELLGARFALRLDARTERVARTGDEVTLHIAGQDPVVADELLVAVGRTPNTDTLNVAAAGLETRESGHLVVDEYQRTSVPGIYALGDVSSEHELKHVANHEERVVQHNLLHPDEPVASDHRYVPHAVFTAPQIAAVGLTERAAREAGIDYTVAVQDYAGIAYGWAMEDTTGFAKLLADKKTGLLIGAHIIGPQAPTLIQPLIQAMSFGLPAMEMARGQYWIHPAMPELIENALLNLEL